MAEALRRARLSDTAIVAALLIILTGVPLALLYTDESRRFHNSRLQTGYSVCFALSLPFLLLGASPLTYFWFLDRRMDKQYFSTATPFQLLIIMGCTLSVTLGCVVLAIGEAFWIAEIGFARFDVVVVWGFLSGVLLLWIALQVLLVMREAASVRKHLQENSTLLELEDDFEDQPGTAPVAEGQEEAPLA